MVAISTTVTDVDPLVLLSDLDDEESALSLLIENVRGFVIINMANADYTMTDAEAQAAFKVIVGAGDGTKILTVPTTSDGTVPANFSLVTAVGGNSFFLASETGGGNIEILAPYVDAISYEAGNAPVSSYTGNVSQTPFDATWENSLYIPTQGTIFDAFAAVETGRLIGRQAFSAVGANTYTPTAGTVKALVYVQGGGGGGGGADTAAVSAAAGGGGGGGGAITAYVDIDDSDTYEITIGDGGAAGLGGAAGGSGGLSSVTFDILYRGNGGTGGAGSAAGAVLAVAAGGVGGTATGGITREGENGEAGLTLTGILGISGRGGSSQFSAGAGQRTTQGDGGIAPGYGAGGGGGLCLNGGAAVTGGAGLQGIAVIFEYSGA